MKKVSQNNEKVLNVKDHVNTIYFADGPMSVEDLRNVCRFDKRYPKVDVTTYHDGLQEFSITISCPEVLRDPLINIFQTLISCMKGVK